MASPLLPVEPMKGITSEKLEDMILELMGWGQWAVVMGKGPEAVRALVGMARARGLSPGVEWIAPGTGRALEPPRAKAGVGVVRTDWAWEEAKVQEAIDDARERGLMVVVDESVTGLRLARGGARAFYAIQPDALLFAPQLPSGRIGVVVGSGPKPSPRVPAPQALVEELGAVVHYALTRDIPGTCARLGEMFAEGIRFFKAKAGLSDEVRLEPAAVQLPRIAGRRAWAFMELAKEEGLVLAPRIMLPTDISEEEFASLVWRRLARAMARLKVLPEGEKAPLGWKDAGVVRCRPVEELLRFMEE